ncbi:MAG: helix-hairpin-helix domain-containing protein, partial [Dehalococcoidia bacterium]
MLVWLERYRWWFVSVLAVPLLVGIGFLLNQRLSGPDPLEIRTDGGPPSANSPIAVYVTGAVASPGVYTLGDGDRVVDAIEAAGGPTADADLVAINLARRLLDEDQIVVPRLGVLGASASPQRININTAPVELLDALPGIGEVRSQRIVDSRTSDGPFARPEDLVERKLIPASVYEQIKDR